MLKWKTTIEKLNIHRKLLPVGYMAFAAISFCGMVRFLTPWIWENKCFSEPYPSAILMAFRRTRIAVGYLTRPGKQIKLNTERKQRERPFKKSACAHLIMPTNVHLHVLRFASFSVFVFYKRKIRNREKNTTGNDQKEEKPWRTKKSTASGNLKKSYRILLKRICRWDRNFCSWRKLFGRRRTADIVKPWQIRFSEKWKTKRHLPGRRTVTTKNTSLNWESFWGNRTVFIDNTEKFWNPNVKKEHFLLRSFWCRKRWLAEVTESKEKNEDNSFQHVGYFLSSFYCQ